MPLHRESFGFVDAYQRQSGLYRHLQVRAQALDHNGVFPLVLKKIDFVDDYRYNFPSDLSYLRQEGFRLFLPFFSRLFEQNFNSSFDPAAPKIPRTLHFFWHDGRFPTIDLNYEMKTCIDLHPGWEVRMWSLRDVVSLDVNATVLDKLKELGHFSMIKTYFQSMVLQKFGGVFLDVDYICLKPLDELIYRYEYFAGLEPYTIWTSVPIVNTGLHAAAVGSRIMKQFKANIERYFTEEDYYREVLQFTDMDIQRNQPPKNQNLVRVTLHQLCNPTHLCPGVIVFPPSYFETPFIWHDTRKQRIRQLYTITD